jgi:hypothetical protein
VGADVAGIDGIGRLPVLGIPQRDVEGFRAKRKARPVARDWPFLPIKPGWEIHKQNGRDVYPGAAYNEATLDNQGE